MPTADSTTTSHQAMSNQAMSQQTVSHEAPVTSRREVADAGRATVVMGWARATLTVATVAVLLLVVARVAFGRSLLGILVISGPDEGFAGEVAGFARQVLPGLLVAWCLGFAGAASAVRATWLGARVAGILAAVLGVAAGTALVVLSR